VQEGKSKPKQLETKTPKSDEKKGGEKQEASNEKKGEGELVMQSEKTSEVGIEEKAEQPETPVTGSQVTKDGEFKGPPLMSFRASRQCVVGTLLLRDRMPGRSQFPTIETNFKNARYYCIPEQCNGTEITGYYLDSSFKDRRGGFTMRSLRPYLSADNKVINDFEVKLEGLPSFTAECIIPVCRVILKCDTWEDAKRYGFILNKKWKNLNTPQQPSKTSESSSEPDSKTASKESSAPPGSYLERVQRGLRQGPSANQARVEKEAKAKEESLKGEMEQLKGRFEEMQKAQSKMLALLEKMQSTGAQGGLSLDE
jgi:hypothetical protein